MDPVEPAPLEPVPGDPFRPTVVGHAALDLCSPLAPERWDALLTRLAAELKAERSPLVLDLAGGKGSLARDVTLRTGGRGVVVDVNPYFLDACGASARAMGLVAEDPATPGEVSCVLSDVCRFAAGQPAGAADLVACVGARPWAEGGVPVSTDAHGDRAATLTALRDLARPGGLVLVGEEFYHRAPDAELQAVLGGSSTDFTFGFEALVELAVGLGFEVVEAFPSTEAELRAYDGSFHSALQAFVDEHPGDPDTPRFRERLEVWCPLFERNPETLGFGWYLLRRTG